MANIASKRPTSKSATKNARSADESASAPAKTVRLNVLISPALHKRVKIACAIEGVSMTDVVTEFLEKRFSK
jgi:predicted HicB family RNase H-like nuclease